MAIRAVLTGDIVNSTQLGPAVEKKLLKALQQVMAGHRFEFYRGDSFQVYIENAGSALQTALLCRTAAISAAGNAATISDIRVSIGIGKVNTPVTMLGTAKGEAFVLSGRAFDEITKNDTRLVIASSNALANEGLQVIADYLNAIFKSMTGKQAGVIFELLKGDTQQAVAAKLKKSKSTINQHVNAGRWPGIEKLIQQYTNIINHLI
ncbi:MAG: hypothetical protein ABIR15_10325 [Chitinophagaceae bacterium]